MGRVSNVLLENPLLSYADQISSVWKIARLPLQSAIEYKARQRTGDLCYIAIIGDDRLLIVAIISIRVTKWRGWAHQILASIARYAQRTTAAQALNS